MLLSTPQLPQSLSFWSEGVKRRRRGSSSSDPTGTPKSPQSTKAQWLQRWTDTNPLTSSSTDGCFGQTTCWSDIRVPGTSTSSQEPSGIRCVSTAYRNDCWPLSDTNSISRDNENSATNAANNSSDFRQNFPAVSRSSSDSSSPATTSSRHDGARMSKPRVDGTNKFAIDRETMDSAKPKLDDFFRHCVAESTMESLADALLRRMEEEEFEHFWEIARVNRRQHVPYQPLVISSHGTTSGQLKHAIYRLILRALRDSSVVPPRRLAALASAFEEIVLEDAALDSFIALGHLRLRPAPEASEALSSCARCRTDLFNRRVVLLGSGSDAAICPACYISTATTPLAIPPAYVVETLPQASVMSTRADARAAAEQRQKEELTIQLLSNKCSRGPWNKRKFSALLDEGEAACLGEEERDDAIAPPPAKRPRRVTISSLLNAAEADADTQSVYESGDDRSPMSTPPSSPFQSLSSTPQDRRSPSSDSGSDGDTGEDDVDQADFTELPQAAVDALSTAGVSPKNIIKLINNEEDRRAVIRKTGFSNNYIMKLQRRALRSASELQLPEPAVHRVPAATADATPAYVDIHVLFDREQRPLLIKKELCAALGMKGTTFSYWKKKSGAAELDTSRDFRLMDRCRAIFGGRSTYTLYAAEDALAIVDLMLSSRQRSAFANLADIKAVIVKYASAAKQPPKEEGDEVPMLVDTPTSLQAQPVLR